MLLSFIREYGVLFLGDNPETGVNIALNLVEEGLAKVRDNCQVCRFGDSVVGSFSQFNTL